MDNIDMGETGRNPIPQVLGGPRRRCSVNLTTVRVISWNLVPPSLRDLFGNGSNSPVAER